MRRRAQPDTVVDGRYRILRQLGEGGMGVVYQALDQSLERMVALKMVSGPASEETFARFAGEARACARLRGENVAQVLDFSHDAGGEAGSLYLVMEYLEGSDLKRLLATEGRRSVSEAVSFALQACQALGEAHAAGIVHRDIKPANLFLTRRPDGSPLIKVLDFGVSKLGRIDGGSPAPWITATNAVLGSPLYMAPEQMMAARAVDAQADVWSLGVVLYEMLSGRLPFEADTFAESCARVLNAPLPPLAPLVPGLPPGLEAVVARCLEKEPAARYPGAAALAAALEPYLAWEPPRQGSRGLWLIGAVAGLAVAAGVAVAVWPAAPKRATRTTHVAAPLSAPAPATPAPVASPPDAAVATAIEAPPPEPARPAGPPAAERPRRSEKPKPARRDLFDDRW